MTAAPATIATAALLVALYGAVLSTLLGIVRFVEWWDRRRGRIRVTVDTNYRWWDENGPMDDVDPAVVFRAVNCGEKPVMIVGLTLTVEAKEIDLTPCSKGDKNRKVIKESEIFERVFVSRPDLIRKIQTDTQQRPPFRCRAVVHTSTGRKYSSKGFTLDDKAEHP